MTIQSPIAWLWDRAALAGGSIGSAPADEYWAGIETHPGRPAVRRIHLDDLLIALAKGFEDYAANRTDVIFLCVLYPVVGLALGWVASGEHLIPLLFPLASGFALLGPLAGVGLNEMSRRRELGQAVSWTDAFGVLRAPSIGAIALLGALLVGIFVFWLVVAGLIALLTIGPNPPETLGGFFHVVFYTEAGWAMIVLGCGVGFGFAVVVLSISVVSFPLLLDRNATMNEAVLTSIRVVRKNPLTMAVWGALIAAGLVIGSIPFLLGLAVVLPVFGHATWHLYRRTVRR